MVTYAFLAYVCVLHALDDFIARSYFQIVRNGVPDSLLGRR